MESKTLHVLLSTYNGQAYLEELLQSILAQSWQAFELHIRDDGSSDNTVAILQKYQARDKRIHVEVGSNIGVQASFYSLLERVEDATGFYAFCDQDDVWEPHKLESAMTQLGEAPNPGSTLYFSRLSCVDNANNWLYDSELPRRPGLFNALVQNSAVGCTCVFGGQVREQFLQANPADMIMHDWWLYLCAASSGELIYDPQPGIRYRQHDNTATPREPGLARLLNRFQGLLGRLGDREQGLESLAQANAFLSTYPDCDPRLRATVEFLNANHGLGGILRRLRFVLTTPLHRNSALETLSLKLVILFDLY